MLLRPLRLKKNEAFLSPPTLTLRWLNKRRQRRLQFLIGAKPTQSKADVAKILREFSDAQRPAIEHEQVEVEPLFSPSRSQPQRYDQAATWRESAFIATINDLSGEPWDIAHSIKSKGGFVRVLPDGPIIRSHHSRHPEYGEYTHIPGGWELMRDIGSPLRHF